MQQPLTCHEVLDSHEDLSFCQKVDFHEKAPKTLRRPLRDGEIDPDILFARLEVLEMQERLGMERTPSHNQQRLLTTRRRDSEDVCRAMPVNVDFSSRFDEWTNDKKPWWSQRQSEIPRDPEPVLAAVERMVFSESRRPRKAPAPSLESR